MTFSPMAFHAVQNIDEAVEVSRSFLSPFSLRRWAKLAIVAVFISTGMSVPTPSFSSGGTPSGGEIPMDQLPSTVPPRVLLLVGIVVLVALLLGLVWSVVGAIMEFVFIESLRSGEVTIGRYWARRWRQGLRLFVFRFLIGLPALAMVLGGVALIGLPFILGIGDPVLPIALLAIGIPAFFLVALVTGVVNGFTTLFVVPIMILEDCGVLAGWSRLWTSVTAEWKQYLVFLVVFFVLSIVAGLIVTIVLGVAAVLLLLPLGLVGFGVYSTLTFASTLGIAIVVLLGIAFAAVMAVLWALVQVPILTYLRYYALLVLGDVEPDLDIIPDRREAAEA